VNHVGRPGTKTRLFSKTNSQFPPIQGPPRALAQVSVAKPDKIYPRWPVSYLAAYGTVPHNDRRLLVEPEVRKRSTLGARQG
jgi:hypothetical protein